MARVKGQQIQPADFSAAMNELLAEYGDEVASVTVKVVEEVGKDARKKLRSKETGSFKDRTGDYRRGWRAEFKKTRTGATATVYNETDYRLTHLLEYGHIMRNGKRSKAYPHIAEVNDEAIRQFEQELVQKLEGRS